MSSPTRVRIATRGSALALWQAEHVAALLRGAAPTIEIELVVLETTADRRLDLTIDQLGGKGAFVKEIQAAVLDGRADIAVHSAKDMPARSPAALVLAAVPSRADARDVLVGARLADLPPGAVIATGSPRRRVQLAALREDLVFAPLRGNIATRLAKAPEFGAIVVAKAALDRLALAPATAEVLAPSQLLPQVGQGALGVECLADSPLRSLVAALDHPASRRAVDAERAFLDELGGDCNLPAGCYATVAGPSVFVSAILASASGRVQRSSASGSDGPALGRSLARRLRSLVQP